ncbi:hypothetical protein N499_0613B, partial [Wolbachia pipientis wVitA]
KACQASFLQYQGIISTINPYQ